MNRLVEYERLKARWIAEHPNATPEAYQEFIRWLCQRLKV